MKKVLLLFLGILSILTYILFKNDQYFPTIVEAKPFKNEFNDDDIMSWKEAVSL